MKGFLGPRGPLGLLGILGLLGVLGCSSDEEGAKEEVRQTVELMPCALSYVEEESSLTRAWTPPTGYKLYNDATLNGQFESQKNLTNKSIGAFFTQDAGGPFNQETFYFHGDKWQLSMEELERTTYYVYGFIPNEVVTSATISGNSIYSDGAVLTLNGVKTVTPNDLCVIVGAKNGNSLNDDRTGSGDDIKRLQTGLFAVETQASNIDSPGSGNYIFLLFDHLYSAIRFNFTVGEKYDALRTIKLRKLEMISYKADGSTKDKAKYTVTVTLKSNTTGASPITSITYEPDNDSGEAVYEPLFSGEETLEHGQYTPFMGCFVPGQSTRFMLRSIYDVYDKEGNMIRKECLAENYIDLPSLFYVTEMKRGHIYSINLTVQPTYLHVLSDPDLDNPTVAVKSEE